MNVESVERDDGGELKCPVCGEVIITAEEGTSQALCKHVMFVYLDNVSEFEFVKKGFQKTADKITKAFDEGDCLGWDEIEAKLLPKGVSVLELTETGLCCGPCSFTMSIGIKGGK